MFVVFGPLVKACILSGLQELCMLISIQIFERQPSGSNPWQCFASSAGRQGFKQM